MPENISLPVPVSALPQKPGINLKAYARDTLQTDERLVYVGHVHWIVYTTPLAYISFAGLFTVFMPLAIAAHFGDDIANALQRPIALAGAGILFVGLMLLLGAYLRRHHTGIAVTDRRLIIRRGHIATESYAVMLDRLSAVHYKQTVLGHFLNFGDVQVLAAGANVVKFSEMDNAHYFVDLVERIISRRNETAAALSEDDYFGPVRTDDAA